MSTCAHGGMGYATRGSTVRESATPPNLDLEACAQFRSAYTDQANVGFEIQIGGRFVFNADYLYARGLERLASLGDLEAVRELSDLISLAAQLHAANHASPDPEDGSGALWLASAVTVAAGPPPGHDDAKHALRDGDPGASGALWEGALSVAETAGLAERLGGAADSIGFRPH